jgi:hypothetical protein
MKTIWKDVKNFEENYMISNTGLLYSKKAKRILCTHPNGDGYLSFHASTKKGSFTLRIHRLVASHFLEIDPKKQCVNHKDGNKLNNNVNNLEWCTHKENTQHAIKNKLIKNNKPVIQLENGIKIKEFESIREASRQTKIDNRRICNNLKGHIKQTDGFTWKYKEVEL